MAQGRKRIAELCTTFRNLRVNILQIIPAALADYAELSAMFVFW